MILYRNIGTALTLKKAMQKQGRHIQPEDLSIQKKIAMAVDQGKIFWLGPQAKIPKTLFKKKVKEIDLDGRTILPGFVECHTHTAFAGDRTKEFELKNMGISYIDIANRGGGILTTVKATRAISAVELLKLTQARVDRFCKQGVTTLEIKSGYALNKKDEIKTLEVLQKLKGPKIIPTFLGAHAIPTEYIGRPKEYLDFLRQELLPLIQKKKLAKRVDIFLERGFFDQELALQYLQAAQELDFAVTIHADQITLSGGAETAVALGALSGDHLLQVGEKEREKLAKSEVTCVLLPTADLYMKVKYPPARAMIDTGCRVALATDFNPGTAPSQDLALTGLLARLEMKMTLPEVIAAYTVGGAFALKLQSEVGSLEEEKAADFVVLDGEHTELFYSAGHMPIWKTFKDGKEL